MTLEQELQLSYYKKAGKVNEAHNVWLVQDVRTNEFLIQKILTVFHPEVYRLLQAHPIPNTPRIRELIEADGVLYVIEEYIPGQTLEEILDRSGPLQENQVKTILVQLCDILTCFHSLRPPVINRDLKPGNLKLSQDGVLKLLDLNAARPCRPGASADTEFLGTAGYAAPEQYGFGQSDIRTDLYAAGKLMQVLLTGAADGKVPNSSCLAPVIEKCTALDPADRYQSAAELKKALSGPFSGLFSFFKKENRSRYLPGFRSANPLLWLLSAFGYYILFSATLKIRIPDLTGFSLTVYRMMVTAAALCILLLTGDFRRIQSRFLGNCRSLPIRILKVLAADCLIFFLLVFFGSYL